MKVEVSNFDRFENLLNFELYIFSVSLNRLSD